MLRGTRYTEPWFAVLLEWVLPRLADANNRAVPPGNASHAEEPVSTLWVKDVYAGKLKRVLLVPHEQTVQFTIVRTLRGVRVQRTFCGVLGGRSTCKRQFKTGVADAAAARLGGTPVAYEELVGFVLEGFPR